MILADGFIVDTVVCAVFSVSSAPVSSLIGVASTLSRSLLIILPLSPEPLIVLRSMFFSAAIFFARGDAKTLLSEMVKSGSTDSVSSTISVGVSEGMFSLASGNAESEL